MKRIIIIGICGAGKSTFAKKLSEKLEIELFHLDKIYWKPNWVERKKEDFDTNLKAIIEKETWIIDGNYKRTMKLRIKRADTVIFLDYSTSTAMFRVFKRRFQFMFKQREDVAVGCKENINWEFLKYVYNFKKDQRPEIMKILDKLNEEKQLIIFKNDKQANLFFKALKK